jgi:hypothetical protein
MTDVPEPTGSRLGDALSVLGMAAAAVVRRLGPSLAAGAWHVIAAITRGQLLAPLPDH